ncbi:MAG: hypothetical protein LC774_03575 [Acidobacteria bacterium]|nr:hypothetical protein [Acidobacteriota bacterium]
MTTGEPAHAAQPSPKLSKLAPAGGNFSVMMPGEAKETVETKDGTIGKYTSHLFMTVDETGLYGAGWVDYEPGVKLDKQGELAANRDNFIKGLGAKLTSETKIVFEGHPGIEFTGESDKLIFRSRVYVVENRPYMVLVGWRPGQHEPDISNTILTSFQLTAAKP